MTEDWQLDLSFSDNGSSALEDDLRPDEILGSSDAPLESKFIGFWFIRLDIKYIND